jgi:hypothetical protein
MAPQYAYAAPAPMAYSDPGCGYMTEMGCGMPYTSEMGCGYSDGMMMPSTPIYPGPAIE